MAALTLFPTCLVDITRPEIAEASTRLLEQSGHRVSTARGATCCGQPAWNAGYRDDARRVATQTVKSLAKTDGPIVVPSGSCTTMIRHGWAQLFANSRHRKRAAAVAERTVELSEFLADDSSLAPAADGTPVTIHDSCHALRELGISAQPRTVLEAAGREIVESPSAERCCGFGGTFSVKLPEVSVAMADEKLDDFVACGATTVVGCDASCLLHLEARSKRRGLDLRFEHIATAIDGGER